jgi:hypothetical protein
MLMELKNICMLMYKHTYERVTVYSKLNALIYFDPVMLVICIVVHLHVFFLIFVNVPCYHFSLI